MRPLLFVSLLILSLANGFANTVGIKEISHEGRKAFMLQVSATTNKSEAETLKQKLSDFIKYPIHIDTPGGNSIYLVQVGPIDDIDKAHDLQKLLADPQAIQSTSTIPAVSTPTSSKAANPQPSRQTQKLWNLRNADIRAVIAEVSRVTGKNFIIDPRVQGKISIISATPMADKELYQVFLAALQVSGFAAIPSGAVIKIIPNLEAKTLSPDSLSLMKHPPQGDEMLVEVIPVHYVPAEQLVAVLRPLMPQWSSVSAYNPSNMLILSGRASNIRQMSKIIRQVDTSEANGIDMIKLSHALAMDVASTLKDLMKAAASPGMHSQMMIAADDRTNSILVSGNKTERIKIRILIDKLDRTSALRSESNTQVIYLHYMRAEDIVPILAGIAQANFSGVVGTTIGSMTRPALDSTNPASNIAGNTLDQMGAQASAPSNAGAVSNTSATNAQSEGSTKPSVQIIGEPNTNSVIINAPAALIRTLRTVISQLDIRPAQLLIQALVVEINEKDLKSLGIEWGTDAQTGKASEFRPGFAIINSKTSLNDLQAQIYALSQRHKANILSSPSVVVLDNRQAKILIGKQVSVASTNYPNNAGGTTPASPYTTFDRVNVALHLYVRPQITREKGIQMQIDQGNDTLDPTASTTDGSTNPTFNISSIVTSVHIRSGDIIVLGGLTQNGLGEDRTGVPILEDIPGLGKLFQHNINSREKKVLMVFIQPEILSTPEDDAFISGQKYNDTRNTQLEFIEDFEYQPENKKTILPPRNPPSLPQPFVQNRANVSKAYGK